MGMAGQPWQLAPHSEAGLVQSEATTVRQKVQRAFAAELLAPFREVEAALAGDFTRRAIRACRPSSTSRPTW